MLEIQNTKLFRIAGLTDRSNFVVNFPDKATETLLKSATCEGRNLLLDLKHSLKDWGCSKASETLWEAFFGSYSPPENHDFVSSSQATPEQRAGLIAGMMLIE